MVRPKTNRGNRNKRNNSNVRRNHSRTKNNRKRKANSSDDDFILQFSDSDSSTTSRRPPKRRLRSQRNSSPQRLRTRSHIAESGSSTECFPAEPRRRRQNYLPSDDTDSDSPLKPLQAKKRAIPVCGTDDSSSDSDSSIGSFSSYFQSFSDDSVESSADDWNLRPRYMRSGRSRSSATTVRRRNRRNNGSTSASSASRANAVSSTLRLSDGAGLRGHRSFNAMSTGGIYLRPRNNGLARVGDRPPTPGPSSRRTTLLDDSDLSSIEDSPSPLQSSALNRRSAATFGRVVLTIHGPNNFEIPERAPQTHEVEVLNAPDTDTEDQVETATVTVAEVDPSGYISSDGESDKCPICLIKFVEQEVGVPGCCEHNFCATCIVKWADSSTTCPVDRLAFTTVTVMRRYGGKPLRRLHFQARTLPAESMDIQIHDHVTCVVCRISGREEELAFCDRCVRPYHITCLTPPLATVPDSWYCPTCTIYNEQSEDTSDSEFDDILINNARRRRGYVSTINFVFGDRRNTRSGGRSVIFQSTGGRRRTQDSDTERTNVDEDIPSGMWQIADEPQANSNEPNNVRRPVFCISIAGTTFSIVERAPSGSSESNVGGGSSTAVESGTTDPSSVTNSSTTQQPSQTASTNADVLPNTSFCAGTFVWPLLDTTKFNQKKPTVKITTKETPNEKSSSLINVQFRKSKIFSLSNLNRIMDNLITNLNMEDDEVDVEEEGGELGLLSSRYVANRFSARRHQNQKAIAEMFSAPMFLFNDPYFDGDDDVGQQSSESNAAINRNILCGVDVTNNNNNNNNRRGDESRNVLQEIGGSLEIMLSPELSKKNQQRGLLSSGQSHTKKTPLHHPNENEKSGNNSSSGTSSQSGGGCGSGQVSSSFSSTSSSGGSATSTSYRNSATSGGVGNSSSSSSFPSQLTTSFGAFNRTARPGFSNILENSVKAVDCSPFKSTVPIRFRMNAPMKPSTMMMRRPYTANPPATAAVVTAGSSSSSTSANAIGRGLLPAAPTAIAAASVVVAPLKRPPTPPSFLDIPTSPDITGSPVDDDVDIYGDIESTPIAMKLEDLSSPADKSFSSLEPPPIPSALLDVLNMDDNNFGEDRIGRKYDDDDDDDKSSASLVIDDSGSVNPNDIYDPTQPNEDSDNEGDRKPAANNNRFKPDYMYSPVYDRMVTYGPHLPLPKPPEPPAICDIVAPSDSDDEEDNDDDNDENSAPVATAATVDADADHDGTISECPNNFSYSHTSKKFGGRKSELILDDIPIPEGDDHRDVNNKSVDDLSSIPVPAPLSTDKIPIPSATITTSSTTTTEAVSAVAASSSSSCLTNNKTKPSSLPSADGGDNADSEEKETNDKHIGKEENMYDPDDNDNSDDDDEQREKNDGLKKEKLKEAAEVEEETNREANNKSDDSSGKTDDSDGKTDENNYQRQRIEGIVKVEEKSIVEENGTNQKLLSSLESTLDDGGGSNVTDENNASADSFNNNNNNDDNKEEELNRDSSNTRGGVGGGGGGEEEDDDDDTEICDANNDEDEYKDSLTDDDLLQRGHTPVQDERTDDKLTKEDDDAYFDVARITTITNFSLAAGIGDLDPISDTEYNNDFQQQDKDSVSSMKKKRKKDRKKNNNNNSYNKTSELRLDDNNITVAAAAAISTTNEKKRKISERKKSGGSNKNNNKESVVAETDRMKKLRKKTYNDEKQYPSLDDGKENKIVTAGSSPSWKRVSKNTKDRNYRDGGVTAKERRDGSGRGGADNRRRTTRNDDSRRAAGDNNNNSSRRGTGGNNNNNSNNNSNKVTGKKRRGEIIRYDVRKVIADKPATASSSAIGGRSSRKRSAGGSRSWSRSRSYDDRDTSRYSPYNSSSKNNYRRGNKSHNTNNNNNNSKDDPWSIRWSPVWSPRQRKSSRSPIIRRRSSRSFSPVEQPSHNRRRNRYSKEDRVRYNNTRLSSPPQQPKDRYSRSPYERENNKQQQQLKRKRRRTTSSSDGGNSSSSSSTSSSSSSSSSSNSSGASISPAAPLDSGYRRGRSNTPPPAAATRRRRRKRRKPPPPKKQTMSPFGGGGRNYRHVRSPTFDLTSPPQSYSLNPPLGPVEYNIPRTPPSKSPSDLLPIICIPDSPPAALITSSDHRRRLINNRRRSNYYYNNNNNNNNSNNNNDNNDWSQTVFSPSGAALDEHHHHHQRHHRRYSPVVSISATRSVSVDPRASKSPPISAAAAAAHKNLTVIVPNKTQQMVGDNKKKRSKKLKDVAAAAKKGKGKNIDNKQKKKKKKKRTTTTTASNTITTTTTTSNNNPLNKEIFASGENILVSVSFNNPDDMSNEHGGVGKRRVAEVMHRSDESASANKIVAAAARARKRKKKVPVNVSLEVLNAKPVAVIDLNLSPFKEIASSPVDVISLTDDSDDDEHNNKQHTTSATPASTADYHLSPSHHESDHDHSGSNNNNNNNNTNNTASGPATPPELTSGSGGAVTTPVAIVGNNNSNNNHTGSSSSGRIANNNRIFVNDSADDETDHNKGPCTPPEPSSVPMSPAVVVSGAAMYDPFEPTKSPASPEHDVTTTVIPTTTTTITTTNTAITTATITTTTTIRSSGDDKSEGAAVSSSKDTLSKIIDSRSPSVRQQSSPLPPLLRLLSDDVVLVLSDSEDKETADTPSTSTMAGRTNSVTDTISSSISTMAIDKSMITSANAIIMNQEKPSPEKSASILMTTCERTQSSNFLSGNISLFTTTTAASKPLLNSSAIKEPLFPNIVPWKLPANLSKISKSITSTSLNSVPPFSTTFSNNNKKTLLPPPASYPHNGNTNTNTNNNNSANADDMDFDYDAGGTSPYSPGSSEGDDIFEPPPVSPGSSPDEKNDSSYGGGGAGSKSLTSTAADALFNSIAKYSPTKESRKIAAVRVSKRKRKNDSSKTDKDTLTVLDDVPNSAVELAVKEKFMQKLRRQERVAEEVKIVLRPHYAKKHITKEEYKDILRKAVPKICHNKSGDINPKKIHGLIEAYVRNIRHRNKPSAGQSSASVPQSAETSTVSAPILPGLIPMKNVLPLKKSKKHWP